VFTFPDKNKVAEFSFDWTNILLKHILAKRIDGLKLIHVNKDNHHTTSSGGCLFSHELKFENLMPWF